MSVTLSRSRGRTQVCSYVSHDPSRLRHATLGGPKSSEALPGLDPSLAQVAITSTSDPGVVCITHVLSRNDPLFCYPFLQVILVFWAFSCVPYESQSYSGLVAITGDEE